MHAETIDNATITAEATRYLPFETEEGRGCQYRITVEIHDQPAISGLVGLGGGTPGGKVAPITWAVLVESSLLNLLPGTDQPIPGSRDNNPFIGADIQVWISDHQDDLASRCNELREQHTA